MKLTENQNKLMEQIKASKKTIFVSPSMYKNTPQHYSLECIDGINRSLQGVTVKALIKKGLLVFTDEYTLKLK